MEETKGMKKASIFFLMLMVLELPMANVIYAVQRALPAKYETLVSILGTQGYLLLAAVLYLLITRQSLKKDLWFRGYKISSLFLSLLVLVTAAPMASWLNIFSQLFAKNTTSVAIFEVTEVVPMWLGILIIGFLPGFVEETIYRGILQAAFRKHSVLTGIIVSALSFGLMHLNFNQILYAIYLGIVFALVVEATGSLVSTMVLHMLFNGMNTAYIYILPKFYQKLGGYDAEYADFNLEAMINEQPSTNQLVAMLIALTPVAAGGLALTILLLKTIAKRNGRELTWKSICEKKANMSAVKPVNGFLIVGWAFCLLIAVSALFK